MAAAYEAYGQEVPEGLIAPDLSDVEWYLWEAFWELSTERQIGMREGPIPWSSIRAYLSHSTGINPDVFVAVIRAMDSVYLTHGKK